MEIFNKLKKGFHWYYLQTGLIVGTYSELIAINKYIVLLFSGKFKANKFNII